MLSRRADDIAFDPASDVPLTVTATPITWGRTLRRTHVAVLAAACLLIVACLGAVIATAGGDDAQTVLADQNEIAELDEAEAPVEEAPVEPPSTAAPSTTATPSTTEAPGTAEVTEPSSEEGPGETATAPTGPAAPAEPAAVTGAVPTPAPSTVSFNLTEDTGAPHRWLTRRCDGTYQPTLINGIVRIERSGPTDRAITIGLAVSGSLAKHVVMKPSVTIPAGQSMQWATMDVGGTASGSVTITARGGKDYVLGSPTTATFSLAAAKVDTDCLRSVPAYPATQTITVGQLPASVSFSTARTRPLLDSALPPGLHLTVPTRGSGDDVVQWSGAATTPGTYRVTVRHCERDDMSIASACNGTSVFTVIVREP